MSASISLSPVVTWVILGIIIFVALFIFFRHTFKKIIVPCVCLITGAPKTGKTLLSVKLSTKDYISRYIKWWIKTKIFRRKIEMPLFYTNGYVNFGFIWRRLNKNIRKINLDTLMRDFRFAYGSVIFIQECSLLADNMDFNNKTRNINLSLFNKLIGHSTKGGALYYDTQSPLDTHYSIKRVASTFFFIEKSINFLLFRVLYVRECINQDIGVNTFQEDTTDTMKKVLIPFWYYKRYNRYEYSYLTDELPVTEEKYNDDTKELVSFNPLYMDLGDKRKKGDK